MSEENSPRKPISKRVRFEVFKRDLFKCAYCGRTPPAVVLHVDHIHPVSKGGKNTQDNLITACFDCNLGKSNISLSSVPESFSDKALRMRELRDQMKALGKLSQEIAEMTARETWIGIKALYGDDCREIDKKTFSSVQLFVEKLGSDGVKKAAQIAISRKGNAGESTMFLYFCGICWRMIKGDTNVR